MKVFLTILFSIYFLNSFSQNDSVNNKFTIGVCPLSFVNAYEDGLYFEYQPKADISFEIGGGIYNFIPQNLAVENTSGFTFRSAVKMYSDSKGAKHKIKPYYEFLFFYSRMSYNSREYRNNADAISETHATLLNGGGEEGNRVRIIGNEFKQVMGVETLFGNKNLFGKREHFAVEYFLGFGFRLKYRDISVTQAHVLSPNYLSPIDPPEKEIFTNFLPTIHCGIKLGYSF